MVTVKEARLALQAAAALHKNLHRLTSGYSSVGRGIWSLFT